MGSCRPPLYELHKLHPSLSDLLLLGYARLG
jgi:hypothetical protein